MADLRLDMLEHARAHARRRDGDLPQVLRRRIASDEVEELRDVAGDDWVGGEIAEVRIDACGDRVVIAGADMHIAHQPAGLAAHNLRKLCMGLQLDEAVDYLCPRALQIARPADVRLFVEARLQLYQRGD